MVSSINEMDKSDWIAVGTAIFLIIGLVLSPILFPNLIYPNTTPEDALNAYFSRLNRGDMKGAVDLSFFHFWEDRLEIIAYWQMDYDSYDIFSFSINNITVYYIDDFNLNVILRILRFIIAFENAYDISVEDYCLIYFILTKNLDGEIRIENEWIVCIKVNSLWYIGPFYYELDRLFYLPLPSVEELSIEEKALSSQLN